jgi:Domain of unknown function (DUF4062)
MKKKLQVFISSTYKDLLAERQAVVQATLISGHIPAGMELFAAGDKSQLEAIRGWIDESDVFMLIMGGRYGSVDAETGKSYIQLEYEYALEKGKPLFAAVMSDRALDDKVRAEGQTVLELDNQGAYKAFKALVLSRISRFFDDVKDLKLIVFESLSKSAAEEDVVGWVPADEVSDPKPLLEEIRELRKDNTALKKSVEELQKKVGTDTFAGRSFEDLIVLLTDEKVEITLADKKAKVRVLDLLNHFADRLVVGVENRRGSPENDIFLFFNVLPKLAIYGLAEMSKPNKDGIQHFQLSEAGRRFLAKVRPLAQKIETQQATRQIPEEQQAKVPIAKAEPSKAKRATPRPRRPKS